MLTSEIASIATWSAWRLDLSAPLQAAARAVPTPIDRAEAPNARNCTTAIAPTPVWLVVDRTRVL